MRLIDVILKTWSVRQNLQDQYEKALPQTRINTAYLAGLADSHARDRQADKPDAIARASDFAVSQGQQPFTRDDLNVPDRQPYAIDARDIDPSKVFGEIEQHGAMVPGGRRHLGILVWEWLVNRLKREAIVLECDDEYAALDSMYCEKVAELSAEMFQLRREFPGAAVPREAAWVCDIENRADNEALAEQIVREMFTSFGVRPERIESEQRRLEAQPSGNVIPAEVLNPTKAADYAVKARHGERE